MYNRFLVFRGESRPRNVNIGDTVTLELYEPAVDARTELEVKINDILVDSPEQLAFEGTTELAPTLIDGSYPPQPYRAIVNIAWRYPQNDQVTAIPIPSAT